MVAPAIPVAVMDPLALLHQKNSRVAHCQRKRIVFPLGLLLLLVQLQDPRQHHQDPRQLHRDPLPRRQGPRQLQQVSANSVRASSALEAVLDVRVTRAVLMAVLALLLTSRTTGACGARL